MRPRPGLLAHLLALAFLIGGEKVRLTGLSWPHFGSQIFKFVNATRGFSFTRLGRGPAPRFEKFDD